MEYILFISLKKIYLLPKKVRIIYCNINRPKFSNLITISFLLSVSYVAKSEIITAQSVNRDDVQSSVDMANDGDVVVIPPGNATWSSRLIIQDKAITLKGAGIGTTVITDETGGAWQDNAIFLNTKAHKSYRVCHITFKRASSSTRAIIGVWGSSNSVRIDHCEFVDIHSRAIEVQHGVYGVTDHCYFDVNVDATVQCISIFGAGDAAWEHGPAFGSDNFWFIEDCIFDEEYANDGVLDAYGGARYVFRHNTIYGGWIGHHGLDSGGYRSPHAFEIYENTWNNDTGDPVRFYFFRGGTGVVFNNTHIGEPAGGAEGNSIVLASYRSNKAYSPWGKLDGTSPIDGNTPITTITHSGANNSDYLINSTNNWVENQLVGLGLINSSDGFSSGIITSNTENSITATLSGGTENTFNNGDSIIITDGYPGMDQIGRTGPTVDHGYYRQQASSPLYEWGNTYNGTDLNFVVSRTYALDHRHIQEGRDYHNDTQKPGYSPYTYPHPLTNVSSRKTTDNAPAPPSSLTAE